MSAAFAAVGTQARDAVTWRLENQGRPGMRLGGRSLLHQGLDAEDPVGQWNAMEEPWPALDDPTGIDLHQWLEQSWFNLDTERTSNATNHRSTRRRTPSYPRPRP